MTADGLHGSPPGFGVLETEGGGLMGRNFALTLIFVIALALTALLFVFELAHVWIERTSGG